MSRRRYKPPVYQRGYGLKDTFKRGFKKLKDATLSYGKKQAKRYMPVAKKIAKNFLHQQIEKQLKKRPRGKHVLGYKKRRGKKKLYY